MIPSDFMRYPIQFIALCKSSIFERLRLIFKKSKVPRHLRYLSFNLSPRSRKLVQGLTRYGEWKRTKHARTESATTKLSLPRHQLPSWAHTNLRMQHGCARMLRMRIFILSEHALLAGK